MSSFPVHWEEEVQSLDQSVVCPYSIDEIEQYLWWCHNHWMLDEKPMHYEVRGAVAEQTEDGRHFWLYQASDEVGREWYVVVGSGKSPFKPSMKMRGWMYGKENVLGLAPEHYLNVEIGDQRLADAR
ncbi:MAG: hypothetical protein E5V92_03580 [Mesorhizobium sp.]|uniref:hypothetical protein n=1 Tax=unclassified Mesorhizobium TaxID=325217 RepID=UPI000F75B287|nr:MULTISPECIES: hypothetical protein [unclassified Mesorhizobium]AZO72739.1 hypothetical protein EJ067_17360 [Mesorhizobium sp. M1D.F.Ca.ET.043.01.1.1]RWA86674.1 MAG: hypothetical protein EOQ32_25500 [Mesorhizobium sp.]RWE15065.1 MAG: hypothetical protein EOS61_10895 [Mesorhizobium sp.]TJW89430.1 MAG: hypothetical protein E5V92_03580 [Mesorhizobium sp.]